MIGFGKLGGIMFRLCQLLLRLVRNLHLHHSMTKQQRLVRGLGDPIAAAWEQVKTTGREGAKDILAGNPMLAFGRVISPLAALADPVGAPLGLVTAPKPTREQATLQALEMAGVPAPQIKEAYQQGDYPRMAG